MANDENSAEDIAEAAKLIGQGANNAVQGGKVIFNKLKGFISPTKQNELDKLKAEVDALEQKQVIEAQIAALKEKKEALMHQQHEAMESAEEEDEEDASVFA